MREPPLDVSRGAVRRLFTDDDQIYPMLVEGNRRLRDDRTEGEHGAESPRIEI